MKRMAPADKQDIVIVLGLIVWAAWTYFGG